MKKDWIVAVVVLCIAAVAFMGVKLTSVDKYYDDSSEVTSESKTEAESKDDSSADDSKSSTAYISIDCSDILNHYDDLDDNLKSEEFVPSDGIIFAKTEYEIIEGETALDLLVQVTKENKIQLEYQGAEENIYGTAYIQGINNIYELSCGKQSGWTFYVNGDFASVGSSEYKIQDGDYIEWKFVCSWD